VWIWIIPGLPTSHLPFVRHVLEAAGLLVHGGVVARERQHGSEPRHPLEQIGPRPGEPHARHRSALLDRRGHYFAFGHAERARCVAMAQLALAAQRVKSGEQGVRIRQRSLRAALPHARIHQARLAAHQDASSFRKRTRSAPRSCARAG
jgi:hypothetical protein